MTIQIEKAHPEDIQEILKLQYEAYQSEALIYNDFSIQPLTETLEQAMEEYRQGTILKAVYNGIIVGSVRGYEKQGTICIRKLIVRPANQNQGIGRILLQAIEDEFPGKRYELFTGAKSVRNLSLYKKAGYVCFKETEVTPGLVFVYLEKQTGGGDK